MNGNTIPSPGREDILRAYSELGSWWMVAQRFYVSETVVRRWRREEGITDKDAAACRQFMPTVYRTRDHYRLEIAVGDRAA